MAEEKKRWGLVLKGLMLIVPIAAGIGIFMVMSSNKKAPAKKEILQDVPNVRVMEVQPMDVSPRVIGYGTSEPARIWKAISQVKGRIIYTHPQLQKGSLIKGGTVLVKIDPSDYKIDIAKLNASILHYQIQIKQLEVERNNNLKLLELQKDNLGFKRKELERQKSLLKKSLLSITEYESQLLSVNSQEVQVQNLRNALNMLPSNLGLLKTQLSQAKNDLRRAELELSFTVIKSPFDIQVSSVNNKTAEYISTGQTILTANDISETEIEAQFVMNAMMPVFMSGKDRFHTVDFSSLSLGKELGISAIVRVPGVSSSGPLNWKATLSRRSDALDSETRTMGLMIKVKNEWQGFKWGTQRPLLAGVYCEVELRGNIHRDLIVIPRSALHPGNMVYLVTAENKLLKRKINTLYGMSNFMVVKNGINPGDILILSDVIPAVPGMTVNPIPDSEMMNKLKADAIGG